MSKKHTRVPSIMYHSVGIPNDNWHWKYLTCPYEVFESQLKWLKLTGYTTLVFQDVYDYVMNDKPVPKKSVFLTFDDGYLDNYIYVYPLLKKYGMKGTIFVNPDFVEKSNGLRKTLDDYASADEIKKEETLGFCNWDELKKIDSEGIIDVQSHAKTHAWYPISDKIIDFRHPDDAYIWMDWNEYPDKKPYLQCIDKKIVKLGSAVFENEKALSSKRVFINEDFQKKLQEYVDNNGGELFFNNPNWKIELENMASNLKDQFQIIDKSETDQDYFERIKFELEFTKNEIEKHLDKKVNFICWPGGSATKKGVLIAEELGYLMSTAARDIPELRKKIINSPDFKINRISRFVPVIYDNTWKKGIKSKIRYSPGWFFILQLMRFQNRYFAGFWVKALRYIIVRVKAYV